MPDSRHAPDEVFLKFDEVRRHFEAVHDDRCVPLLLGALGSGDGHGTYQMVEATLLAYPEGVVVPALKQGLASPHASVRYWSAQIAAVFPCDDLLDQLVGLLHRGGIDERLAAVTAIESVGSQRARDALSEVLRNHGAALGTEAHQMASDALESWSVRRSN